MNKDQIQPSGDFKKKRRNKRIKRSITAVVLLSILAYTLFFLYSKDQEQEFTFKTESPEIRDIYKKTVATGSIVPREEIDIKPRVSGVIDRIYVEDGENVKKGTKLARIKIIPDVVQLNNAENRVKNAELNLKNAKENLKRQQILFEKQVISENELDRIELNYDLALQEVEAAKNNLELVQEGALKGSSAANNLVVSTVEGMILDVPIKEGASVIESNNFNDGTTVVTIADMSDMIFEGEVDESEVGKIKEGMNLSIKVGAIEGETFDGKLEFIAPKGTEDQGTIQFGIKAAVQLDSNHFVRAGYSANAEIVLESRQDVLSIEEALIIYEKGKSFVEVETENQVFEKREIELGLSDGIYAEVKRGLEKGEKVKVQEGYGKVYR